MRAPRRHFLFGSLAGLAGTGSAAAERGARMRPSPSGFMGVRGRGNDLIRYFGKRPDVEIAYLADVDTRLLPERAAEVESLRGQRPETVQDFRRVLDDKSVDALVIATPDHWHALGTIWACQAGKDVYVEKPTSHSIWESRKMVEAARKHGRVVQVGAQCRSAPYAAAALEYLRSGKLGEVHFVKVFNSKPRSSIGKPARQAGSRRRRLRHVARPGPDAPVQREPLPLRLALVLELLRRRPHQRRRAPARPGPLVHRPRATPGASPPRAASTSSRMTRRRPIPRSSPGTTTA